MNKFISWFVKITGFIPFVALNRPKYYYEDKSIQNRRIKSKAIIMSNHHSLLDFATVMYAFALSNIHCLVAEVMFQKSRLFAWFLKKIGCVRVDREEKNFTFLDSCINLLQDGKVVEIFPEGRLPLKDEELPLPFKHSISYIFLESDAPIIPFVTDGNYIKKKRLNVMIGKPIYLKDLVDENLSKKENIELITKKLREKIIELSNELREKTKKNK